MMLITFTFISNRAVKLSKYNIHHVFISICNTHFLLYLHFTCRHIQILGGFVSFISYKFKMMVSVLLRVNGVKRSSKKQISLTSLDTLPIPSILDVTTSHDIYVSKANPQTVNLN